ncbi:hypothetical protein D9758_016820 [Tetrapyrgos nigripes]|uniref:Uncharacterized protein n=1 Tax=Tetrapyrgos nigripes TaxID=182062 RepID=A0A8H5BTB1_9AGAR|nr:hypothetical protein D9758_016820 [Tetrapyrgos nigripes]
MKFSASASASLALTALASVSAKPINLRRTWPMPQYQPQDMAGMGSSNSNSNNNVMNMDHSSNSNSNNTMAQLNPHCANDTANGGNGNFPGALYFMTNEPDGSNLVIHGINNDGTLTFTGVLPIGGVGSKEVTDPVDVDPLGSQASVKVSGNSIFIANAGSSTVSMFNIDPNDPINPTMAGFPISSGGEFPISLTVSKKSGQVCVVNTGAVNGISCYTSDPKLGLTPVPNTIRSLNLDQTTPPSAPINTASQVVFTDDGQRLLVSVKGNPGFVASWDVNEDGSLSPDFVKNTPSDGGLLSGLSNIGKSKDIPALVITDAALGVNVFKFDDNQVKSKASNTPLPIDGQNGISWAEFSPVTGNFYVTDKGTATLTEIAVADDLKASVVGQTKLIENSATIDLEIATIGDKDFAYVMAPNAGVINVLDLQSPGKVVKIEDKDFCQSLSKAGVKFDPVNIQAMNAFFVGVL